MKYQAIKHLKTKSKVLKICDTLAEADAIIKKEGAIFKTFSYIGGFPSYCDSKGYIYSVQGQVEGLDIVCSLNKNEIEAYTF